MGNWGQRSAVSWAEHVKGEAHPFVFDTSYISDSRKRHLITASIPLLSLSEPSLILKRYTFTLALTVQIASWRKPDSSL